MNIKDKLKAMVLNRKGMSTNNAVEKIIGAIIVVVLLGAVGSMLFTTNWTGLGAPAWFGTAATAIIAIGIFVLILAVFGLYKMNGRN